MRDERFRRAVTWAGVWLLLAALLYFVAIPWGIRDPAYAQSPPGQFPRLVTGVIAVAAALLVVSAWRRLQPEHFEPLAGRFFLLPALAGLFAVAVALLGFLLPAMAAIAAMLYLFGERRHLWVVLMAVVGGAGVTLGFIHLLNVPLPIGPS